MKTYKVTGFNVVEKKPIWKTLYVTTDDVATDVWLNEGLGCIPYDVEEVTDKR